MTWGELILGWTLALDGLGAVVRFIWWLFT